MVNWDVVFDESKGWNWNADEMNSSNEFVVTLGEFRNHGISTESEQLRIKQATDANNTQSAEVDDNDVDGDKVEIIEPETQSLRRSERIHVKPKYLDDYILIAEELGEEILLYLNNEPKNFSEAKKSKEWTRACVDEIDSIEKNETWILVDLPYGAKAIGLKWVFKIKRNADGSINKYKSRLVAKGYVQCHGIDYDEVFAPVARIKTIRLLLNLAETYGWAVHHLDVKTAFLHGELKETVYVTQPEGFENKGEENKVYKLKKALYGLKQALRAWNNKLNRILCSIDV